jgi:hypothetical protein
MEIVIGALAVVLVVVVTVAVMFVVALAVNEFLGNGW